MILWGWKLCPQCGWWIPLNNYHIKKSSSDGHQSTCKSCKSEYNVKYKDNNRAYYLLNGMQRRARKKHIPCTLPLSDVERLLSETTVCPIFGFPLKHNKEHADFDSPACDRIDPTKGYELGNVQIIANLANQIKSNATADQVLAVGHYMKKQEKEKKNVSAC